MAHKVRGVGPCSQDGIQHDNLKEKKENNVVQSAIGESSETYNRKQFSF